MHHNTDRKKAHAHALAGLLLVLLLPGSLCAVEHYDIDYLPGLDYEDARDRLDIYMPEGARLAPVIVYFHGGALRMGSKEDARTVVTRFVKQGIGVVAANYRLSPAAQHPAHVTDAAAATAWVLRNIARYGGDPDRVYLAGHSAGAYLAALLTLDPVHLAAHDLSPQALRATIPISPFLFVEETAAVRPKDVWGRAPAGWLAASVTPHIKQGKPAMLLIYADGDEDWRKRQNETFAESMRAVGNDVRAVEVPRRDHMTLISEINHANDRIGELVREFIAAH